MRKNSCIILRHRRHNASSGRSSQGNVAGGGREGRGVAARVLGMIWLCFTQWKVTVSFTGGFILHCPRKTRASTFSKITFLWSICCHQLLNLV